MPDIINVDSLTKRYNGLVAVDDITFSVRTGEVFGILGPNGAGKTTTLECIESLIAPTSGSISVFGMDIARDSDAIKRRIGVQLQASAYYDYLTLTEILDLFALIYDSDVSPAALLGDVGLLDKAGVPVAKLSGGQQQRFTIAATLINDPELVFLDEPTAGLDPQARRALWDLVQSMNRQGRTVVMTTHYMDEAEHLCDRVAIMDRGKIVALDTPDDLVRSLAVPYRISVRLDDGPLDSELEALDAVVDVAVGSAGSFQLASSDSAATVSALVDWASSSRRGLSHLQVASGSLEDVFLSLTGRELGADDTD